MSKIKIFNDPIYGLISFPFEIIYDLIDHPYFQRLRRISQMGLSNYVYPGAVHSRFNHALGVVHLCCQIIQALREKGVKISEVEYEACCVASLLHDLGHGPFSHALEFEIVPLHHEDITLVLMEELNRQMDRRLDLAIKIFKNEYDRPFLSELLSSQLDIDRMDYLNRDSFYTGVAEGIIGYQRILKMMNVADDHLVVEEKGIYSVEKFLISRYLMYNQVYLHKTALASEQMLLAFFRRYKELLILGESDVGPTSFDQLLLSFPEHFDDQTIDLYVKLDDNDLYHLCKICVKSADFVLRFLGKALLNRQIFKTILLSSPFKSDFIDGIRHKVMNDYKITEEQANSLIISGEEKNTFYSNHKEIIIKRKNLQGEVPFSQLSQFQLRNQEDSIFFLSYPKPL